MRQKDSSWIKLLSVIVPAYRQEKTIVKDIKSIHNELKKLGYPYEIIVVVDGQVDKTYKEIKTYTIHSYSAVTVKNISNYKSRSIVVTKYNYKVITAASNPPQP